jgi:hypothetical protein
MSKPAPSRRPVSDAGRVKRYVERKILAGGLEPGSAPTVRDSARALGMTQEAVEVAVGDDPDVWTESYPTMPPTPLADCTLWCATPRTEALWRRLMGLPDEDSRAPRP